MRLMLFESNPDIATVLVKNAKNARFDVDIIHDQQEALSLLERELANYAALLIGNMEDPVELIETLRQRGLDAPIIILSDRKNAELAISAFSAGADDFVVKPFNPSELKARIFAVTRRMNGQVDTSFALGRLTVHMDGRDPEVEGSRIKLSHREHAIFHYLVRNLGRVVSKEAVYEAVYGSIDSEPFEKVIDVYICKLRKKLADATDGEQFIETVYCRGYKMDGPEKTVVRRLGGGRKAA